MLSSETAAGAGSSSGMPSVSTVTPRPRMWYESGPVATATPPPPIRRIMKCKFVRFERENPDVVAEETVMFMDSNDLLPCGPVSWVMPDGRANRWHGHVELEDGNRWHERNEPPWESLVLRFHPYIDMDQQDAVSSTLHWCLLHRDGAAAVWQGGDHLLRPVSLEFIEEMKWNEERGQWVSCS